MPRWVERRGYTLRVPQRSQDEPSRYVRVSLMERAGLMRGLFNVREARAEPDASAETVRPAGGRALSWRWLSRVEAERLLDARLGTLDTIGYTVLDAVICSPGRWEWLYELVNRGLRAAEPEADLPAEEPPTQPLRETLTRLGPSPDHIIEGAAAAIDISPHALAQPSAAVARAIDAEHLAVLLPFLARHERAEIRSIAARWLALPEMPYQLSAAVLRSWLESDRDLAELLAPRLDDEALALLGPELVHRLARTSHASVRESLQRWAARLGG